MSAEGLPDRLPTALVVVAVLFMLQGAWAAIEVIRDLFQGTINLNFGVLLLFAGIGVLRLRPGWRTCGLVFTWIGMALAPMVSVAVLFLGDVGDRAWIVIVVGALVFGVSVWEYLVLTRPDIRRLFGLEDPR